MSRFEDILDDLATMPVEIYDEPTDEQEQEDADGEQVITLILYESENA